MKTTAKTYTQKTLIEKPSQKLLDFVRDLERRKSEMRNKLLTQKDKYFSPKK